MIRRTALLSFTCIAVLLLTRSAWAATYPVGSTRTHKSVCALLADSGVTLGPDDVIDVDAGTYTDACQVHASGTAGHPIILQGAAGPRPVFDAKGLDLSGSGSVPRAILQFTNASYWVVQHLEFENAANGSNNGAAFRVTAGGHDITYRDVSIHDNNDGAQSDGPVSIVIENSEIFHNGAGDGQSHNLYLIGDFVRLQGNYIHDSVGGQNVKLRVHTIELFYNLIANEGNYAIDFEQAANTDAANANAVMIGNVVIRNPNAENHGQTIVFGADNGSDTRNGNLYAINNTFIFTQANTGFLHMLSPAPGSKAYFYNNVFHTTANGVKLASDATSEGLMSGSNNWVTTGITTATAFTASVTGADPGFVSATDFHLATGAAVIDQGMAAPMFADGTGASKDGTPTLEYGALSTVGRPVSGLLDLGAYEFGTPISTDGGLGNDGGIIAGGDAGLVGSDAGRADGGSHSAGGSSSGCGCDLGSPAPITSAWPLLLGGAFFVVRRRRRR
ncbi:MAG: hypothetical protein ABI321_01980 [Polyangia bacterium]